MYYLIDETLTPCTERQAHEDGRQFVAIVDPAEWKRDKGAFDMGIDIETDLESVFDTQAEVNYDSITGAIFSLDRKDLEAPEQRFAFALDEKGVVFIDGGDTAEGLVASVAATKRWRSPGLERFLSDFLTMFSREDATILRGYEQELDDMEQDITVDTRRLPVRDQADFSKRILEIRGELHSLDDHYIHLMDMIEILEENENGFFQEENLRFFRVAQNQLDKLHDQAATLRDQALQVRDLYQMHLDMQQNRVMTLLTVVTAIFAPLTLIVGWYGMNFEYMPELSWTWGYPAVIALCIAVAVASFAFFKHRKWL